MQKAFLNIISILLVLVMSLLALGGCDIFIDEPIGGNHSYHYLFPSGYTGGFRHQPGADIEYWWVETYEECLDAIQLLKSHGSTFKNEKVFTYDGNMFDCKYCFVIRTGTKTEKIKWGDNPFDRYAYNVSLVCYAFLDDVTIDELNHSLVTRYEAYVINLSQINSLILNEAKTKNVVISEWATKGYENAFKENYYHMYKQIFYEKKELFYISTEFDLEKGTENNLRLTDECLKEMVKSGKIINLK